MRAFVIRPFGEQGGVDFERVHRDLIKPALEALRIEGDTTEEIAQAGNIRRDMFKLLADGGPQWVERFNRLYDTLPSRVLGNSQGTLDLPRWPKPAKNYSIWERNNRWMLNNALVYHARNVTLLALWNQNIQPDGAGGTQDMVKTARDRGAKVVQLDAAPLASMAPAP